jgi:hypothetical protein
MNKYPMLCEKYTVTGNFVITLYMLEGSRFAKATPSLDVNRNKSMSLRFVFVAKFRCLELTNL